MIFAALADHLGDINDKINIFVALAPAVYILDDNEWLKKLSSIIADGKKERLEKLGVYELFGPKWKEFSKKFPNFTKAD